MNKTQKIKEYNTTNKGYNITGIKKLSQEHLQYSREHGAKSLDELYNNYSNAKQSSFQQILETYKPKLIRIQGNSQTYSAYLVAENGDTLWITRDNNYLVEVTK
jgi:hypothetical protein